MGWEMYVVFIGVGFREGLCDYLLEILSVIFLCMVWVFKNYLCMENGSWDVKMGDFFYLEC